MPYVLDDTLNTLAAVGLYIALANAALRLVPDRNWSLGLFAGLNLAFSYILFFHEGGLAGLVATPLAKFPLPISFAAYVMYGVAHWALVAGYRQRMATSDYAYWLLLAYPLAPLVVMKSGSTLQVVGFSYMSFRMAQFVLELQRFPSLSVPISSYLAFLFFPLTIPVGPISPYSTFARGLAPIAVDGVVFARGLARIVVGYVMYRYLAVIAHQLSFTNLWTDGYQHGIRDFLISGFSYLLFLYLNFSGFCHMVIGASALIGMPVKENFNNPLLSTSIKDFWGRWHISLSEFVRDLVFMPASTALVRRYGLKAALRASIAAAMVTFVIIGLWHGVSWGLFVFGLMHGAAFSLNLVYDEALRRLPKPVAKAWRASPWATLLGRTITLTFVAATTLFIECPTPADLRKVVAAFHMGW